MLRIFVARYRGEPLRMATLGILFIATIVAAVLIPRQIQAALQAAPTENAQPTTTVMTVADVRAQVPTPKHPRCHKSCLPPSVTSP